MRGRWAAGIVPRNFCWIIKDHLAVSERPGGYAPNHRKVRRHEELLWLRAQHFTRVVSLLGSTHNLHAYEELGIEWSRFAMPVASDTRDVLSEMYPALHRWLGSGERLLLHQEELGDCVMGVVAGYLLWSELLPDGPRAITAMEQLLRRQMGTLGRRIVSVVDEVPPLSTLQSVEDGPAAQQHVVSVEGEATDSPGDQADFESDQADFESDQADFSDGQGDLAGERADSKDDRPQPLETQVGNAPAEVAEASSHGRADAKKDQGGETPLKGQQATGIEQAPTDLDEGLAAGLS
jgi:hypothetical protein